LEFEFVVIGKEAEKEKWLKCSIMRINIVNVLSMVSNKFEFARIKRAFIRDGKRSR